jgi:hypothetical protein
MKAEEVDGVGDDEMKEKLLVELVLPKYLEEGDGGSEGGFFELEFPK